MCLEPPFDLENVSFDWVTAKENNKDVVQFKAYLAGGTKMEHLTVSISPPNSLVIGIHDLLKKEEGGTGKNFRIFTLPDDVNPNGFNTAMGDAGALTVTFNKKKKLESIAKKMLGFLAQAVPAACLLICEKMCEKICEKIIDAIC